MKNDNTSKYLKLGVRQLCRPSGKNACSRPCETSRWSSGSIWFLDFDLECARARIEIWLFGSNYLGRDDFWGILCQFSEAMRSLGQTSDVHDDHYDHGGYEENEAVQDYTRLYKELWVKRFSDFRDKISDQFKMG